MTIRRIWNKKFSPRKKNLSRGPDRTLSTIEELNRYETIMDSYLIKTIDRATGELVIFISSSLTDNYKVKDLVSEVVDTAGNLIRKLSNATNKDIRRISAKADFLRRSIKFYDDSFVNVPVDYIGSYVHLLDVLEKEEQEKQR